MSRHLIWKKGNFPHLSEIHLIVNTTPVGMFPDLDLFSVAGRAASFLKMPQYMT